MQYTVVDLIVIFFYLNCGKKKKGKKEQQTVAIRGKRQGTLDSLSALIPCPVWKNKNINKYMRPKFPTQLRGATKP